MKKFMMIMAFLFTASIAFAQKKESNYSKWSEVRNGSKYRMEVTEEQLQSKIGEKPNAVFSIGGEVALLDKVVLVQKDKVMMTLALSKAVQEINVEPGVYTLKFYHKKIGEKEFEVNLKKGDHKNIKLTLK
ncbi:hypothetical protein [Pedobacter sp. Hv1]|uniref:hypothetical protein n=1 Tax=Pedobacter sp. Hv1 TaxID=1740090 RepID=UPI0006D8D51A|nr:hypothetical protein [Pedobacter sp. Hv1]KQC01688.1 hypothetical protein AQF98_04760 [Pedobacter sp. Hv1]